MDEKDSVLEFFHQRREEMTAFLERLVQIESGSYQKEGLDSLGRLLSQRLKGCGFSSQLFPQKEYGDHLLLTREGEGEGSLLLLGHLDTVFSEGVTRTFPFRRKGAFLYGPGVSDMKGGLVTTCYGMEALAELGFNSFKRLYLFFNSDEELGSPSSQPIIEDLAAEIDGAYVVEPARFDGSLVVERKGFGMGQLQIQGQSAHAGVNPEEGISAIEELAHQILSLSALQDDALGLSINIGTVKGGTRVNVVADTAEAQLEFRFFQLGHGEELLERMKEQIKEKRFTESQVHLTAGIHRHPVEKTRENMQLLSSVQQAGDSLGIKITLQRTGGISDGNILASKKVPLVDGMGPIGFSSHSLQEHLLVDSLPERGALLTLSILNFFQEKNQ